METKNYHFIVRAPCKETELGDVVSLFTKKRDAVLKVKINDSDYLSNSRNFVALDGIAVEI